MSTDTRDRLILAPHQRRRAVVSLIRSARRRLILSIFRCDDETVLEELSDAVRRGVHVSVITTGLAKRSGRDLAHVRAYLARRGAEVRRYPDAVKYHAKYIVADNSTALVASLNFTRKCFQRTCDFIVLTADPAVVSGLSDLFAADWTVRGIPSSACTDRLIVGPEQRPRERFAAFIRGARRRIRILDAKLADPRILALLDARRDAGVAVEIRRGGDLGPLTAHGKLLIVDDEVAVVGSIALSATALEARRELAVVLRDRSGIRQLDAFWRSLPARRVSRTAAAAPVEERLS